MPTASEVFEHGFNRLSGHMTTADAVVETASCSICHAALPPASAAGLSPVRQTHCGHVFHVSCLRRWVTHSHGKHVTCPMCRVNLDDALSAVSAAGWRLRALTALDYWLAWPLQHFAWVRSPPLSRPLARPASAALGLRAHCPLVPHRRQCLADVCQRCRCTDAHDALHRMHWCTRCTGTLLSPCGLSL